MWNTGEGIIKSKQVTWQSRPGIGTENQPSHLEGEPMEEEVLSNPEATSRNRNHNGAGKEERKP